MTKNNFRFGFIGFIKEDYIKTEALVQDRKNK